MLDDVSPAAVNAPWTPTIPDLCLADGHVIRELPPDEWAKLAQTDGPFATVGLPWAESCKVLVLENPVGVIVKHWPVFDAVHIDGLWSRADYRQRAGLDRLFLGAMITMLQRIGVQYVYAVIHDDDIPTSGKLAEACGFTDRGRVYAGPVPTPRPTDPADPEEAS